MTIMNDARNLIENAARVLIISHVQPDADAYGSSLAMYFVGLALGKECCVVNESGLLPEYAFLPGSEVVQSAIPETFSYDLLCVCDCGDEKRVGDSLKHILRSNTPILNIDHHISNTRFGSVNLVEDTLSSTCELVAQFSKTLGLALDASIATNLLTGIVGDTGSFRYRNASPETLRLAAELSEAGADLSCISGQLFAQRSLASVHLESDVMSKLKLFGDNQVAKIVATKEMLQTHGATKADCESLVEKARDIRGVRVSIFIREDEDVWKVSLRSVDGSLNMSEVAGQFGGGGHLQAAAFRYRGDLTVLEKQLMELILAQVTG
ncbi:MAG: bifunctional oligoribonuclease/PAP phosphatase NrnA [Bdellovibrionales bacterium]|nr:bifunctional oligoribonuclease/PAP phosphatase NrnA [Bdellovibrionales bacterium]